jgi:hypothetical protein
MPHNRGSPTISDKVETANGPPTFIGGNSPFKKLADDRWETIAEMVRDECKEPPDPDFRKGIALHRDVPFDPSGLRRVPPEGCSRQPCRANRATAISLALFMVWTATAAICSPKCSVQGATVGPSSQEALYSPWGTCSCAARRDPDC